MTLPRLHLRTLMIVVVFLAPCPWGVKIWLHENNASWLAYHAREAEICQREANGLPSTPEAIRRLFFRKIAARHAEQALKLGREAGRGVCGTWGDGPEAERVKAAYFAEREVQRAILRSQAADEATLAKKYNFMAQAGSSVPTRDRCEYDMFFAESMSEWHSASAMARYHAESEAYYRMPR